MNAVDLMYKEIEDIQDNASANDGMDSNLTAERITEMIDSATEQLRNSTLNNVTDVESLKKSIESLAQKIDDITTKLNTGDNIIETDGSNED